MNAPEHFEVADGYACYRPLGTVSLDEGIPLVSNAIAFARDHQIPRLLVDTTGLTGFPPPDTWERYRMGKTFAEEAQGVVIVVLVARDEMIDPQRFAITVARNRGMVGNVFSSEAEAMTWLLNPDAD